jgi:hypothetical protein
VEVVLPEYPQEYTDVSFHLSRTKTKSITFQSCKSQNQRDEKLKTGEWKLKKVDWKCEDMNKIKKEYLEIDIHKEISQGMINYICTTRSELSHSACR